MHKNRLLSVYQGDLLLTTLKSSIKHSSLLPSSRGLLWLTVSNGGHLFSSKDPALILAPGILIFRQTIKAAQNQTDVLVCNLIKDALPSLSVTRHHVPNGQMVYISVGNLKKKTNQAFTQNLKVCQWESLKVKQCKVMVPVSQLVLPVGVTGLTVKGKTPTPEPRSIIMGRSRPGSEGVMKTQRVMVVFGGGGVYRTQLSVTHKHRGWN